MEEPFPPESILKACVRHYRRPTREHGEFARHRRAGRSFPTDYVMPEAGESVTDHWNRVVLELNEYRGRGPKVFSQSRQSVAADKRVFAGPSDADIQALPNIEPAWCFAEFMCAEIGLRSDTWTTAGLKLAHLRYGLLLDWLARDVGARMSRTRDGLPLSEAWKLYGLDPIRVSMEHGAVPDELDALAASTGLYERGELSPFGQGKDSRFEHQWIDPDIDPGYNAIALMKQHLGDERLRRSNLP